MDLRNVAYDMSWGNTIAIMSSTVYNLTEQLEKEKKSNAEKDKITAMQQTEIQTLKRQIEEVTPDIIPVAAVNM